MKYILLTALAFLVLMPAYAQQKDEELIRKIYNEALAHGKTYNWLHYLSKRIGARLRLTGGCGSSRVYQTSHGHAGPG
jgi:hypothetical protein